MESVLSDTSYQNYDVYGDNLRIEAVRSPFLFPLVHARLSSLPSSSSADPRSTLRSSL